MCLGSSLIKHPITYCSKIGFIRHRQAAPLSARSRCLAFTPMTDRLWLPAAPLSCHLPLVCYATARHLPPERRHFLRHPKWGPSDFGCRKKLGDGHGLRRPTFVLRSSQRALRAAPGLPQWLDAVSHGLALRLRRRSRAALRRNARPYGYAGSSHSARRLRSLAFLCSSLCSSHDHSLVSLPALPMSACLLQYPSPAQADRHR